MVRLLDVQNCPRCGSTHIDLVLLPLLGQAHATEWTTCPKTSQPILVDLGPANCTIREVPSAGE